MSHIKAFYGANRYEPPGNSVGNSEENPAGNNRSQTTVLISEGCPFVDKSLAMDI